MRFYTLSLRSNDFAAKSENITDFLTFLLKYTGLNRTSNNEVLRPDFSKIILAMKESNEDLCELAATLLNNVSWKFSMKTLKEQQQCVSLGSKTKPPLVAAESHLFANIPLRSLGSISLRPESFLLRVSSTAAVTSIRRSVISLNFSAILSTMSTCSTSLRSFAQRRRSV